MISACSRSAWKTNLPHLFTIFKLLILYWEDSPTSATFDGYVKGAMIVVKWNVKL